MINPPIAPPTTPLPTTAAVNKNTATQLSLAHLLIPISAIALLACNVLAGLLLMTASQESQVSRSNLEALRRNHQNQEKLQTDLATFRTQIDQLYHVFPSEGQIPEFIQFVNDTGAVNSSNVTLNFATNQPTPAGDNLFVIPFVIIFQGDITKLPAFIAGLHRGAYQVRLKHLETQTKTNQSASPTGGSADVRLEGEVYVASPALSTQ